MTRPRPVPTQTPRQLHLLAWNAKVGRKPSTVVEALVDYCRDGGGWPDAMVLCESGRYAVELRRQLGSRYRVLRAGRQADGVLVLVDRTIPLVRWRTMAMRLGWIGPKAFRRHPGRTFPVVDLGRGKNQPRWRLVGIHRTPGGPTGGLLTKGRNRPAWNEEDARLLKLGLRKGSRARALVMVGDQNCEATDPRPRSGLDLARRLSMRVIRGGAKVDWAMVRDVSGTGHRGPELGSDHPLVRYKLTQLRAS